MFAIKKGSGLVVGIGEGSPASTTCPELPLTRKIVRLNDGEIVTLYPNRVELHSVLDGSPIELGEPEMVVEEMSAVQKGGFAHFMLRRSTNSRRWRVSGTSWKATNRSQTILNSIKSARNVSFSSAVAPAIMPLVRGSLC